MNRIVQTIFILSFFSLPLGAQSLFPGQSREKLQVEDQSPISVKWFDLNRVRLLDSPFKANMERDIRWVNSIANERLLHSFRNNAGVFAGLEGGYTRVKKLGGWESLDCDLRGHSMGHMLSGLALLYAQTGEERFRAKADSLVKGLGEVQTALNRGGFLSAYPEELINRNVAGKSVWAPWYTLHKIYAGLLDQYLYCDNLQALEMVKGAADWAYAKLMPLNDEARRRMIRNEFGGVNETFYNLYALTGEERYQELARFFFHDDVLRPLMEKNTDLNRKHANTFIPKLLAEARNYELNEEPQSRQLAEFFWQTVVDHQTFAPGCNSDKEKFIPTDALSKHLSGYTGESCNSYNMLKLTRHLFSWNPTADYMDFYERVLYNQILGQQDPKTGMVAYFLPMLSGAHKVYSTPFQSFWCCVGSSFENQAKYGESIYAHSDDQLWVNLYIPSELSWSEQGVAVRQETSFPDSDRVVLTVQTDRPKTFTLRLRYPRWATSFDLYVNGRKQRISKARSGEYVALTRKWKSGDRVELRMGMSLRLLPTNDDPTLAALAYGPMVLAGRMGSAGFEGTQPDSDPTVHNDYYTYDYRIPADLRTSLSLSATTLDQNIKPIGASAPLEFETKEGVRLAPLCSIHRERYVIYWQLK